MCPLELKDNTSKIIWTQPSPNAPKKQRPILLQTGKESSKSLQSLAIFNNDISRAEEEGFVVSVKDDDEDKGDSQKSVNIKSKVLSYMLDRKAANLYLGLGGAYCDLCHHSKEDCLNEELIENGIDITKDIGSLHNVFDELLSKH